SPWWQGLGTVLVASMLVTSLVMGGRSLGWLEQSELNAYDHLLRSRPAETMDERLLLVEITDEDIESQPVSERGNASLSDRTLEDLLETLQRYEPNVIGLRLRRDQEAETEQLASLLQSPNFFAICRHEVHDTVNSNERPIFRAGYPPPPETPEAQVGFLNTPRVRDDKNRRHYFAFLSPFQDCPTQYSWDFMLASHYLLNHGIEIELTNKKQKQYFGNRAFRVLQKPSAAYQNLKDSGYQIMLNYRVNSSPFRHLSVAEILSGNFDPSWIQDKIILIGTNAPNEHKNNDVPTPYSPQRRVSSLEVRGHMVSQIISAALDNRPIIWWWSNPVEVLWVLLWSIIGGLLSLRWHSPLQLGGLISLSLALLYGICWILFLQGGWIPLIPPALALMVSSFTIVVILSRHQDTNSVN
ncbi:CHASE2 domain-containing protein, partial [Geitlerinema sp. P-1104]|uniref:CHASE2 domain-containing protein n=1 Tax=Geitlerinema sp. P-1104 TaxID=2546230 RepID=UPI00197FC508